jgi:hypothetical protein
MVRPLLTLIAALGVSMGTVGAAEPLKPLRTLVYDVTYSLTVTRREQTSGFGGDPSGMVTSTTIGHGEVVNSISSDDRGKLTVTIVAATQDGGLVADVAFAGKSVEQKPIRVAILSDGRLSYHPGDPLCPEALRLLPFLARGLLTDREIDAGASWSVPATPPATGAAHYRIEHVDGSRAVIGIESTLSLRGPRGFDERTEGTTTYATDLLSPLTLDLNSTARHELPPNQSDTTTMHVAATQVSDSFAHH